MAWRTAIALIAAGLISGCSPQADQSAGQAPQQSDTPFYLTLETPPAPQLTPEQALETFVLAPGFQIEPVAAEPLIEDPVAADWDEDGNLYVVEMRAYMPNPEGSGEEEPIGMVVRLSDSNADGLFDQRQVIMDGLVLPRALRIVNEGLLVAEMGKLWLCPSASGWSSDINCSNKQFLGIYGEHQGSVEHAENGLLVGLDNWIYNAKSNRRLKLKDGELIEQPTAFRGQWGITQDDAGRLYYNTNSNLLLGDYYDVQSVVAAGNRGAPGVSAGISPRNEVFSVRVNPGVNRAYLPGVLRKDGRLRNATSASGMVVYRGGQFGVDDPNVFVTEPAANLMVAFKLNESGIAVSAEQQLYPHEIWGERDFLASTDERFRPVDVMNGPDGALYVIDFYRGIIQDHVYLSDQLKAQVRERGLERPLGMGRIWRISKKSDSAATPIPAWRKLSPENLLAYLDVASIFHRSTAQRLLLRSEHADVNGLLDKHLRKGGQGAVHALWVLEGRGELTARHVQLALQQGGRLREAALLAGGHLLNLNDVVGVLSNAEPGSRAYLYALASLRMHNRDTKTLETLQKILVEQFSDPHVRAFVQASARGQEPAFITALVAQNQWSEELEASANSISLLTQQYFRSEGSGAQVLLDYVASQASEHLWVQQAVLVGLFETTREPGFERSMLPTPHPLFEEADEVLWPAVSRARRGFTWPGDTLAADAKPLTPQQSAAMAEGEAFFTSSCANCHGADGAGVAALGPPLAGSPWVTQAPERLARIVLHGLSGPIEVAGVTWNSAMPGHKDFPGFDDEVASGLLTYLRRAWGHSGRAIDPEFVAGIRSEHAQRTALWTVAELQSININTHFEKYAGAFGRPNAPMTFAYDGKNLTIDAGIFSGALQELKEDHFLFEPRAMKFEFVVADDGSVPAVRLDTGDGSVTMPRVPHE